MCWDALTLAGLSASIMLISMMLYLIARDAPSRAIAIIDKAGGTAGQAQHGRQDQCGEYEFHGRHSVLITAP